MPSQISCMMDLTPAMVVGPGVGQGSRPGSTPGSRPGSRPGSTPAMTGGPKFRFADAIPSSFSIDARKIRNLPCAFSPFLQKRTSDLSSFKLTLRLNEKSYRLLLARVRKLTSRAFNSFFEKFSTGTGRPTILQNSSASFFLSVLVNTKHIR